MPEANKIVRHFSMLLGLKSGTFRIPNRRVGTEATARNAPKAAITQPNHGRPSAPAKGLAKIGPRKTTAISAVPADTPILSGPSNC